MVSPAYEALSTLSNHVFLITLLVSRHKFVMYYCVYGVQ
jgi:hypothetical protein